MSSLATLLYAKCVWDQAEPLCRRALAIDEQSYGADHPNVAIHLNNLAQLLKATNRLAEAEPLRADDILKSSLSLAEQPGTNTRTFKRPSGITPGSSPQWASLKSKSAPNWTRS